MKTLTLYKCTRANGRDFRTDSVQYEVGAVLEVTDTDPASAGACGRGLHLCRTAIRTCLFGDRNVDRGKWRWFEVEVADEDIIAEDSQKVRVRKLTVVREVKKREIFGDLKVRAKKCRKVASTFKRIPWLKPKRRVTDEEVADLVRQWREALQSWAKAPLPAGLRVMRAYAAAAAADAAAYAEIRNLVYRRRWYVRPCWVLRRLAWHEMVRKRGQSNPWVPLVKLYRLGCLPIGYVKGKDGPKFAVYCPEPVKAKRGGK